MVNVMPDSVEFKLEGFDDHLARLKKLETKVAKSTLGKGMRRGMKIVRDAARDGARGIDDPQSAANIPKNIVTRTMSKKKVRGRGDIGIQVGVMGGAGGSKKSEAFDGLPGKDTRHWRFIELGTAKIPARPFMGPSLEKNTQKVTSTVAQELKKELDKF